MLNFCSGLGVRNDRLRSRSLILYNILDEQGYRASPNEQKIPEEARHIFRSPDNSGDARLTVSYIGQRKEQGGRNGNQGKFGVLSSEPDRHCSDEDAETKKPHKDENDGRKKSGDVTSSNLVGKLHNRSVKVGTVL